MKAISEGIAHILTLVPKEDYENAAFLLNCFIPQFEYTASLLGDNSHKPALSIKRALVKAFITRVPYISAPLEYGSVVLWPWQKGHLEVMVPIYLKLKELGFAAVVISQRAEMNYVGKIKGEILKVKYNLRVKLRSSKWEYIGEKLIKLSRRIVVDSSEVKEFAWFVEIITYSFRTWMQLFEETVLICEFMHSRFGPQYLMVGNQFTLVGRTAVLFFNERKIPTGCPMHGTILPDMPAERFVADFQYVYGNKVRNQLLSQGIDANKLRVVGSTKLDTLPDKINEWSNCPSKDIIVLAKSKPIALVTLSGPGHTVTIGHHRLMIQELAKAVAAFPQLHFIFKLHRKDKEAYYKENVSLFNNTSIVPFINSISEDIYEWIFHSNLLITGASTTALEALVLEKPVITMDLLGELPKFDFITFGATLHTRRKERLIVNLASIIENTTVHKEARRRASEFIKECYANSGGTSASQSIAEDVIARLHI
jgi:hypothetical protein